MNVTVQAYRMGNHASLALTGPSNLAHATAVEREVENAQSNLDGCSSVDIDKSQLDRIDGAGAILLARLLYRLEPGGSIHHRNPQLWRPTEQISQKDREHRVQKRKQT